MKWRCRRQKTAERCLAFLMVFAAVLAVSLAVPRKVSADSSENRGSFPVKVGGTRRLSSHGGSAPYRWSSGNPSVALVVPDKGNSNYATVYGVSPGTTTIVLDSSKLVPTWDGGDWENFRETWVVTVNPAEPTATPTPTPAPVTVTGVTISKSTASLVIGNTLRLTASVRPSNAVTTLRWSSNASGVAAVNANGLVTAKKAGTATITVTTANGRSASCKVTVKRPAATAIKLNKIKATLGVGETLKLTGTLSPSGASEKITWISSNTKAASVSTSGSVKAKAAGKATITAKLASGIHASCTITVIKKPTAVKLSKTSLAITKGASKQLTYSLRPAGAVTTVTWSSSNPKIASVTSKGVVKGVKTGTTTITAKTANGKKAACKVTVKRPAATAVKLKKTSLTMNKRETQTLSYTLTPSDAAGTVTWSSSNAKIASVNSKGIVTAKSAGTATITAKISSKVYAKCKVKVTNKVLATSVSIKAPVPYVGVGKTLKLTASAAPSDTTDKIVWKSSNTSIATVASDGTVRGLREGCVAIKATAGSVSKTVSLAVTDGFVCDLSQNYVVIRTNTIEYGIGGKRVAYTPGTKITFVQSNPSVGNGFRILADKDTAAPIHIVLANVKIAGGLDGGYISTLSSTANVILELMNGSSNSISASNSGICHIASSASAAPYLIIQGNGSLKIQANGSAIDGSNITIKSGNLTLTSAKNGRSAVIGGNGAGRNCKNISILSGAAVKAYGGYRAVGGGMNGVGTNINIAEGSLTYEK